MQSKSSALTSPKKQTTDDAPLSTSKARRARGLAPVQAWVDEADKAVLLENGVNISEAIRKALAELAAEFRPLTRE